MSVIAEGIKRGSIAERLGIKPGDALLSVNGHDIADVLDYGFHTTAESIDIELSREGKTGFRFHIRKEEYEDLGLIFRDFLMDSQHACSNSCIFCFVDQLPKGMRETLYFKDDDERLSFFFGNYISLTNLSDDDIERLAKMRVSPINVSVHTTNPALRRFMMGSERAGTSLSRLHSLARAGIEFNCQIVLCPGINDGEELEKTLSDLEAFYPSLRSVSVVPVGLTAHRENLVKLKACSTADAVEALAVTEARGAAFLSERGLRLFYPSDEWFILAKAAVPELDYYDELPQLENGVGMLALLKTEFHDALSRCEGFTAVPVDIVTGEAASEWISELIKTAKMKFPKIEAAVHVVKNEFFGGTVTVAGLLTGGDIMRQATPRDLTGKKLLIPRSSLRSEGDIFLDGVSLNDLSVYYNKKVIPVSDGYELFSALGSESTATGRES